MARHPSDATGAEPPRQAPRAETGAETPGGERVAKALARAGVASRREVERMIAEGRVALNGAVLDTPAVKVGPGDVLSVDGAPVAGAEATRVWRYHKPAGLMTTHSDPQGRPTVFERLPAHLPRVISVGRLDLATEGLLLLTNDGALSRALELPSTGWVRQYRARAFGRVTQAQLDALREGVEVEGVRYGPIEARIDKATGAGARSAGAAPANLWISVKVAEGKNREVRRVLESLGLKVNRLVRLAYGPFALGTLGVGQVEEVGPRVIREQLAGLVAEGAMPAGERPAPAPAAAGPPPRTAPSREPPRPRRAGPPPNGQARR
ncbi:MAG: rRNA pseudouridine synthase, partial [Caulobacteraceae bacterium]|nr:rRNA pseudouridine synthase [Caulobacter sp.]